MDVPIKRLPDILRCEICRAPDPRIIDLFTHGLTCGRLCFQRGQQRYARLMLKMAEDAARSVS